MNSELRNALEVLRNNCKEHEDCIGCELFEMHGCGCCYLNEKVPEEYLEGEYKTNE